MLALLIALLSVLGLVIPTVISGLKSDNAVLAARVLAVTPTTIDIVVSNRGTRSGVIEGAHIPVLALYFKHASLTTLISPYAFAELAPDSTLLSPSYLVLEPGSAKVIRFALDPDMPVRLGSFRQLVDLPTLPGYRQTDDDLTLIVRTVGFDMSPEILRLELPTTLFVKEDH